MPQFRLRSPRRSKSLWQTLEDRVLFDAVIDPAMIDAAQVEEPILPEVEVQQTTSTSDGNQTQIEIVRKELVIIDRSVEDYDQLVADLLGEEDPDRDLEVVLLDASGDGLSQLSEILSHYSGLDAIHLVSHGQEGSFLLGETWVNEQALTANAGQIAAWGDALTDSGDILLYGCDVAGTEAGRDLVDSLAALTGRQVAGSDDDTGSSARGGDWDLEYTSGDIESEIAFSQAMRVDYAHVLAPGPSAVISGDQDVMIGEDFNFTVTFDNAPPDTGFGPYIDLILPFNGADGSAGTDTPDGIDFVSATYLGNALNVLEFTFPDDGGGTGTIDHPYFYSDSTTPMTVSGTAGDKLIVIELPFGSVTPGQPEIAVDITASLSDLADLGTGLEIQTRSGFRFGGDELDNADTDPSVVSDNNVNGGTGLSDWAQAMTVTPTLMTLAKNYLGPESETATGPNHTQQYSIVVDIADGQTIESLDVIDRLPPNMVVTSIDSVLVNGAAAAFSDNLSTLTLPANGVDLIVSLTNDVTGQTASNDVVVTFSFYIDEFDASGDRVIPITGEDDTTANPDSRSQNNARAVGDWTPLDSPRDSGGTNAAVADPQGNTPEHILDNKSIAIQKSVSVVGGGLVVPGATLEYELTFQISDYYTFADLIIDDIFQDGQRFDFSFGADFDITDFNGQVVDDFVVNGLNSPDGRPDDTNPNATLVVNESRIDLTDNAPLSENAVSDGETVLRFDVSQALQDAGAADGILQGGLSNGATNLGAATGTIRFRTIIQEDYADVFPSTDRSVDQGDLISNNDLTITASVRQNAEDGSINNVLLPAESDGSSASVSIEVGSLTKEIFAINGNTSLPLGPSGNPALVAGDVVTYRVRYSLPTSDFENLQFADYLPLPIFNVDDHNADGVGGDSWSIDFDGNFDGISGTIELGAGDNFFAESGYIPPSPTISVANNSLVIDYGYYDDPGSTPNVIELYINVTAQDAPTADGLQLTNIVRGTEDTTQQGDNQIDGIVQIEVTQPVLSISKGIVAVDNANATLTGSVGPSGITFSNVGDASFFSGGNITSNALATGAINANAQDLDAGDRVRYAIVVENTGNSAHGAFDVNIVDSLPVGMSLVTGSLAVVDGTGTAVAFTGSEATLLTTGITLVDPSASQGSIAAANPTSGANVVIVFFEADVNANAAPNSNLNNVASLTNYAGRENGEDHTPTDLEDNANVRIARPTVAKSLVGTEINTGTNGNTEAVIGEVVDYQIVVTVPEGIANNFVLVDTLDAGLVYLDGSLSISPSANVSTSQPSFAAVESNAEANVNAGGNVLTFDFGNLTNNNTDNTTPETITITLQAVVTNVAGNQADTDLNNNARVTYSGGPAVSDSSADINILEPAMTVDIATSSTSADVGNPITFTVTITNPIDATDSLSADAYNVLLQDLLPAGLTFAGNLTAVSGITPDRLQLVGSTIEGEWNAFAEGGVSVISFDAVTNSNMTVDGVEVDSDLSWTSLPGDETTPRSPSDALSVERTGDAAGPGLAANDYRATDSVTVPFPITPTKSILSTSETHTADTLADSVANPSLLAIGEIVTFELRTTIGEGTLNNVIFRDLMTQGLTLISGTETFEIVSDTDMTVDVSLDGANAGQIALPSSNVTVTGGVTQTIDFNLGTIINNDSDADAEELVITFQAIVSNVAANVDGTEFENQFEFREDNQSRATSNTVYTEIIEPEISNVNKRVTSTNATGTQVTYEVTFANSGNASAFDVSLLDTMATELQLVTASIATSTTGTVSGIASTASTTSLLDLRITEMAAGSSITVTYNVDVIYAGNPIENDADVTFTSLPGAQGTGSVTPGNSGDNDGERNGNAAGPNDYNDTDNAFLGSIGDRLFFDIDGDGIDDTGEPGLAGTTVNLVWFGNDGIHGTLDDVNRSTTTDSNGNYVFAALPAGEYRVSVDAGTLPNGITTPTVDLDGIGSANVSLVTLVDTAVGIENEDVDFGYTGSGQLGDLVYLDINGDGSQDTGEMGLANVDINLTWHGFDGILGNTDDESYSTTTDSDGGYNFTRLPAGSFTVDLVNATAPLGTIVTTSNDTHVVALTEGQDYDDSDFGLRGPGSIGDFVFFDSNNNGAFDAGIDSAYPDVAVTWSADIDGDGIQETFSTTTDANGAYNFQGLPLDAFTVLVTPPTGTTPTFDATGPANNESTATLTAGSPSDNSQDFGLTGSGSIGDIVYWDHDGNGSQNGTEVGLAGVTVQLQIDLDQDGSDEITLTTTTAADGSYQFDNLPPGAYTVVVTPPPGTTQTADDDGLLTPHQSSLILGTAETRDDQDFGYNGTGSIGDLVFFDYLGDGGVFNASELDRGMSGVDVILNVDVNGDSVSDFSLTTTTASDGSYSFGNLVVGDYTITVDSSDLPDQMGNNPTFDADGISSANQSRLTLTAGETNTLLDFGYHAVPDYNIVIDDGETTVGTGQALTYTVTVRNDGTLRGNNTVVTVSFPTELLESVAASTGGIVDAIAGTVTWNATTTPALAVMNVGEEVVFTIDADVVGILDGAHTPITLTSNVTDDLVNGVDPNLLDNTNDDVDQVADVQTLKNVTSVTANGENWDVSFVITVENTGSVRLDELSLVDDLASQFGSAFVSVTTPVMNTTGITVGTAPTANAAWAADTSRDMLDPANVSEFFLPGESYTVSYTVTLDPDFSGTSYTIDNQAEAAGSDITTAPLAPVRVNDDSDSGASVTTTNPGEPGDQGTEDDPTPVSIPDVSIAKIQAGATQNAISRHYTVGFTLNVENIGTITLDQLSLLDNVASQFGDAFVGIEIGSLQIANTSGTGVFPSVNVGWETNTALEMINAVGASLDSGDSFEISFNVIVDPDGVDGVSQTVTNQAIVSGRGLDENGAPILDGGNPLIASDLSDSGASPNNSNPDQPGDSGGSDDPTPVVLPEIGVSKRLVSSTSASNGGNRELTYELVVRNLGTVDLTDLSLFEDLDSQFGTAFRGVVSTPTITASGALVDPNLSSGANLWDGASSTDMFDGASGHLRPGDELTIRFTVEVDIDQLGPGSSNQVQATGDWDVLPSIPGPNGTVSDLSDTGTDPGSNNPGTPGDTGGFDDPTLIPAIGIAKQHGDYVEWLDSDGNGTGRFTVPTTLVIENLGATDLTNLNLRDDLAAYYGNAFVSVSNLMIDDIGVVGVSSISPTLNHGWMTDTTQNLLAGGMITPGDSFTITFDVVLNPDAGGQSGYFNNQAAIVASDPSNATAVVQDISDSGLDPATNNTGEPGDQATADDPTPIAIPDIGLAKQIVAVKAKGLSYELTLELVLANTGTVDLENIALIDDIADQYGDNFNRVIGNPVIVSSSATTTPTLNAGFAADTTQGIFTGTDGFIRPGESITLQIVVEVTATAGQTEVTVINQAIASGDPLDEIGNRLRNGSGTTIDRINDNSDSGFDATGFNPGAPGDTGSWDDPTPQTLTFFTFDAFNDFSQGRKSQQLDGHRDPSDPFDDGRLPHHSDDHSRLLTKQISQLAPEPSFSGSARPGTQIVGRVFDSVGRLIGEETSFADVGGNWMMQFHQVESQDHARFEFVEVAGTSNSFDFRGDIYGYLGADSLNNDYASLEPWTFYDRTYEFTANYRPSVSQSLMQAHQLATKPIGFGR